MVVNAALYPPACPTRIKKSRLVIPIEKTPRTVQTVEDQLPFRHHEECEFSSAMTTAVASGNEWNFTQEASWPTGLKGSMAR
jgi:hypothetical protein